MARPDFSVGPDEYDIWVEPGTSHLEMLQYVEEISSAPDADPFGYPAPSWVPEGVELLCDAEFVVSVLPSGTALLTLTSADAITLGSDGEFEVEFTEANTITIGATNEHHVFYRLDLEFTSGPDSGFTKRLLTGRILIQR